MVRSEDGTVWDSNEHAAQLDQLKETAVIDLALRVVLIVVAILAIGSVTGILCGNGRCGRRAVTTGSAGPGRIGHPGSPSAPL
jgi:hypothetical protein